MAELGAAELWAAPGLKAWPPPASVAREDSASAAEQGSGSRSSVSTPSLNSLSQQSSLSLDLQPAPASKRDAKAINTRVMQSQNVQELFEVVVANLHHLDSINTTAALQRLAKILSWEDGFHGGGGGDDSGGQKAAALSSPVFGALTGLMVAQCAASVFNSQSTANAWWAVAKLHSADHPASIELVVALEDALVGCLTAPREFDRPNAQACSATWWSWGRIASNGPDGYVPSPTAAELLWDRSQRLSLAFDSQGVSNMLWAWGLLAKRHGAAFPIRTDVLSAMAFVVARLSASFAVQGLSCAVVGCANMGPAYRASVTPIVHLLIAQSLHRITRFNMQAMANMATALSRMGHEMLSASRTRLVLAAFDAHAVALPPTYKQQDALNLANALRASGITQPRFNPYGGVTTAYQLPPPPPRPPAGQQQPARQVAPSPEPAACLRDSTNQPSRFPTDAPSLGSAGALPPWVALCAAQLGQLAGVGAASSGPAGGLPPPPPPPPQRAATPPPPPSQPPLAGFTSQLPPGATSGPLTISGYTALAQQLAAAAAAASSAAASGRPYGSFGPTPPPPQALPLPILVAPVPVLPNSGGTAAHGQWHGWSGQHRHMAPPPPPPPPPASADGAAGSTQSDPLRLQTILAALHLVQLQQRAGSALPASARTSG